MRLSGAPSKAAGDGGHRRGSWRVCFSNFSSFFPFLVLPEVLLWVLGRRGPGQIWPARWWSVGGAVLSSGLICLPVGGLGSLSIGC